MNTIIFRRLRVVEASLHLRNVFSTEFHSQTLFSQFASTKLNLCETDITRMLKLLPRLKNLRTLDKVEDIVHSLKKHGCTEVQIAQLITRNPKLLCHSLENHTLPRMEFLKNLFGSEEMLVKVLLRSKRLLNFNLEHTLKPSLAFWKGWGFSGTGLLSFLLVHPDVLARTALVPAQVDLINRIGADKESTAYKYIVNKVARSRVETLEAKIENLEFCGLSAEEALQVVRAFPSVFSLSKEDVSEKINFVVTNMEQPANYVVKHPSLLQNSLEKTMRPRFLVWQKIKSISALEPPLLTVLTMPKTRFFNRIVKEHPQSERLWAIYENAISSAFNRTKNITKRTFSWSK